MTDKVQKIKDWISKEQDGLMDAQGNFEYPEHEGAYHILCNLDAYIDSLQEEPVSNSDWLTELQEKLDNATPEQLEELWNKYNGVDEKEPVSKDLEEAATEICSKILKGETVVIDGYEYVVLSDAEECFKVGAKWQKANLWKPADGDDLPEIDREVIALLDNGKVVFAHRPPEYWDGKDIVTGKVTRNYPKTYDKGGWSIPNIVLWLDVELPKECEGLWDLLNEEG